MHPMIQVLADRYGIKLSDRVAADTDRGMPDWFTYDQALYNGKDLATRVQRWKIQYTGNDEWDHLEERSIQTVVESMTDHEIMHDIGHYVAASAEQKDLPEFGLGTTIYGKSLNDENDSDWGKMAVPAVVEEQEGRIQEYMATLLSIKWGRQYGINPDLTSSKMLPNMTWDEYEAMKFQECQHYTFKYGEVERYDGIPAMWEAMFRLQGMNLL